MKIIIVDSFNHTLLDQLQASHFVCTYEPDISETSLYAKIQHFEGIICRNKINFDKKLIDKGVKLKFICHSGIPAGNSSILEYAKNKGILCLNPSGFDYDSIGEHTLTLLLCLFNHICRANMQVKNGIWKHDQNIGIELKGKTLGIIGFGNAGAAFAKKLSGMEVSILAYDKYKSGYGNAFVNECDLEQLYDSCDIISLHLPNTQETHHLADLDFLNRFKKSIYLVNTSSGYAIKTADLAKALQTGKVLGAALDVLEFEKSAFEKLHFGGMPEYLQDLIDNDNVLFTPNIAGWTKESDYKHSACIAKKIIELLKPSA
jgi:D-3-phosphoglycerate dehydrogenase / 2-oxoglutarate reductase